MSEFIDYVFQRSTSLNKIDNSLYSKYNVKNGLRNEDGTGVLVGLTRISDVVGYKKENGKKIDTEGELYYRGVKVSDFIKGHDPKNRFLFEEACFLILFGYLPNKDELDAFKKELASRYDLPLNYLQARILGFPMQNMMNKLQQEVLMLYTYDETPDDISPEATLNKGLDLIAKIPEIVCYAYRCKVHYFDSDSLFIHPVNTDYSIAENILQMLRINRSFTKTEASVLDMCLVLHADHGGGNNSTFTNVVMSSTGTDIYSCFAGAIGSLKGPKHGGANLAVAKQMELVIDTVGLNASDEQIRQIVNDILDKNQMEHVFFAVYDDDDNNGEFESLKRKFYQQLKGKFPEFQKEQTFDMKIIKGPSIEELISKAYIGLGSASFIRVDEVRFFPSMFLLIRENDDILYKLRFLQKIQYPLDQKRVYRMLDGKFFMDVFGRSDLRINDAVYHFCVLSIDSRANLWKWITLTKEHEYIDQCYMDALSGNGFRR